MNATPLNYGGLAVAGGLTVAEAKASAPKKLEPIRSDPDPSCKKCYGRGHVGTNIKTGRKIACKCVLKKRPVSMLRGAKLTAKFS